MSLADQLAQALAQFEGYFAGPHTRAARNLNPGNLRAAPNCVSKDSAGYCVFATEADGWAALNRQIQLDTGRGLTLQQFVYKYAPPSENPTQDYLDYVTSKLGVPSDTPLAQLATVSPPSTGPGFNPPSPAPLTKTEGSGKRSG